MAHHADAEVAECVRCPMMRRRYLAGIFVKVLSGASGEMTDCGKGKTFRAAGGLSSNRLTDDGLNELNFQSALHILVHAHMGITVLVIERPGAELEYVALVIPQHLLHSLGVPAAGGVDYRKGQKLPAVKCEVGS